MKVQFHIVAIGLLSAIIHPTGVDQARDASTPQVLSPPPSVQSAEDGSTEATDAHTQPPGKAPAQSSRQSLRRFVSVWLKDQQPAGPALPVFDGAIVTRRGRVALIGGVNESLEITPAIQVFKPGEGWLPIGSQLTEPRAQFTITPIDETRYLITGGVQGRIGSDTRTLATCEVLDPFIAGTQTVEPLDEPLIGHTAHRLDDGRIVIVGGSAVRIFDPKSMVWTKRIRLNRRRAYHCSAVVDQYTIVIIGGDRGGTIESIDLSQDDPQAELWPVRLSAAIERASLASLPEHDLLLIGGVDWQSRTSLDTTWWIDVENRAIRKGPSLRIIGGVADPFVTVHRGRIIILGGERITPESRAAANVSRMIDLNNGARLWSLAPLPDDFSRRSWQTLPGGRIALFGGYRFVDEEAATKEGIDPGVHIGTTGRTLRVGGLPAVLD